MINKIFTNNEHFVEMMNIINESRLNPPQEGHKHHIIPKCWFKKKNIDVDNSENNLVLLSYSDHVKVHELLYHCSKGIMKSKMAYAYHRLTEGEIVENGCFKGENAPNFGKIFSDETRKKMSKAQKGKVFSAETRRKISEAQKGEKSAWYGKTHSDETIKKMSESSKGENNPFFGKTHSAETRRKMSVAKRGNSFTKGMTSPTKGKSWKLVNGKRIYSDSKIVV